MPFTLCITYAMAFPLKYIFSTSKSGPWILWYCKCCGIQGRRSTNRRSTTRQGSGDIARFQSHRLVLSQSCTVPFSFTRLNKSLRVGAIAVAQHHHLTTRAITRQIDLCICLLYFDRKSDIVFYLWSNVLIVRYRLLKKYRNQFSFIGISYIFHIPENMLCMSLHGSITYH